MWTTWQTYVPTLLAPETTLSLKESFPKKSQGAVQANEQFTAGLRTIPGYLVLGYES